MVLPIYKLEVVLSFDSDEYDEYIETMNKMKANNNTIVEAERFGLTKLAN